MHFSLFLIVFSRNRCQFYIWFVTFYECVGKINKHQSEAGVMPNSNQVSKGAGREEAGTLK